MPERLLVLRCIPKYPLCLCLRLPRLQPPSQLPNLHVRPAFCCRYDAFHKPLLKQLSIHLMPQQGCVPVCNCEQRLRVLGHEAVDLLVGQAEGVAGRGEIRELLVKRLECEHRGTESSGRLEQLLAYVSYFGFDRGNPQRCSRNSRFRSNQVTCLGVLSTKILQCVVFRRQQAVPTRRLHLELVAAHYTTGLKHGLVGAEEVQACEGRG